MGVKVVRLDTAYWPAGWFGHYCPGCQSGHEISVEVKNHSGAQWTFNGNVERPVFSPSINMRWGSYADPKCEHKGGVCHCFIRDGRADDQGRCGADMTGKTVIDFCGDSTHALAGKVAELPDLPAHLYLTSQHPRMTSGTEVPSSK